jgi:thiol-disulfide isomerase/thioredoxin
MTLSRALWLAIVLIALPSATIGAAEDVHPFGRGSWQQIRRAHAGEPLVVHFWGVTCGPCRAEMPQWGRLLNERVDLHLVTIDADLVPNAPSAVRTMLDESGLAARADNWMFGDDFVERLRYEIDPQWQGEIPRTVLIAADGTTRSLEGVADFAEIRAWLDAQARGTGK